MQRKTIASEVTFKGFCPFHGGVANVRLCSAKCGSGIRFIRDDLINKFGEKSVIVVNREAHFDCSKLNTIISNGCCEIYMVEHILSALWAFRISDIDIHIDCNEIPMMDGSSSYWVSAIETAGEKVFDNTNVTYHTIDCELKYEEDDKYILLRPCDRLKITYTIDFHEQTIGKNTFVYDENINSYKKDISFARTFCTEQQVSQHMAIKKYFNNYDMIVYGNNDIFIADNVCKKRYSNEPTRHKILDLIGDLMSTGDFFCGEFICYKSGHSMNRKIIDLFYNRHDAKKRLKIKKMSS